MTNTVRSYFAGKRVLVTGAAGSVGAALANALSGFDCAVLALLDHHDHGLLETVERVEKRGVEVIEALCDIRDAGRVSAWVNRIKPDIVIHAAALKHVHVGERHPGECILSNLIGMKNVLEATIDAGASRFLLVSTDKAASPVCVMGASKRLGELYIEGRARDADCKTALKAVRFGNVLGSQGSVEPRFAAQIEAGGPLQVTHPDMKRFFMMLDEAVSLLLSVIALDDTSGVYFQDMGEPISILAMGQAMIARSGRDIAVEYIGLRPGEKLNEELYDEYEHVSETSLRGVFRVAPLSRDAFLSVAELNELEALARATDEAFIRQRLFAHLDARLDRAELAVG